MNDTFGGEFNANQGTDGAAADSKAEGIAPALIKQVLNSPEGNFQMFDMKFSMVCVRGIVRNIDTSSTKITYTVEDSTGRIEAHYWLEEGGDALKTPDVMLNKYATVYGSVRSQGGQKTLMVFKMFPINDPNEVSTHILEVLNARYKAEEFATKGSSYGDFGGSAKLDTMSFATQASNDLGLDDKNLAVFQAIKNHMASDGISRAELRRKFNHMKADELNGILEFMSNEGHIYSSIDADHFLSTE